MKPRFRSSELDRIIACHGSAILAPMVNPPPRLDGHEGAMLHWTIASRAINELGATPPEGGLPPPQVPAGYKLPGNSLWIVDWALRHIQETIPEDWSLIVEVEMEHEYPRWVNPGHADIIGISPDGTRAKGIDWKTGRDPVDPADENWQVFSYECLKKLTWPTLTHIEFQIAQPRVTEDDEVQRISTSVLEGDRLERGPAALDAAICTVLDTPMEMEDGKKQCRWCPVGAQCEVLKAERDRMKMTLTKEMIAKIRKEPDDATLADWVITSRILAQPTKDATEQLHKRIDELGVVVAANGTTITREIQKGSIEVTRPVEFYRLAKEDLVTDERMAAVFTPSKAALIDQLAEAKGIPKTGQKAITATGLWDAQYASHVKQGERRILRFNT